MKSLQVNNKEKINEDVDFTLWLLFLFLCIDILASVTLAMLGALPHSIPEIRSPYEKNTSIHCSAHYFTV